MHSYLQLKGCTKKKLNSEVDKMIESIGLVDKRNTRSSELSGGMKRKLCVGISLIGGSKVNWRGAFGCPSFK